jgi:hypothetical protein
MVSIGKPAVIFIGLPLYVICGLVVIYCFSLYLSWKNFIAPSILNDSFAG